MATPASMTIPEAASTAAPAVSRRRTSIRSIVLVVLCTLFGAAAQILMRFGADYLPAVGLLEAPATFVSAILTNYHLIGGLSCLGLNTALLVLALREGQLSVLYPIIALTYVWVTILSPMFFHDPINLFKVVGVGIIVVGVSLIGIGSRR